MDILNNITYIFMSFQKLTIIYFNYLFTVIIKNIINI